MVVVGMPKALKYMISNTKIMERYSSLKDRIVDITEKDIFVDTEDWT